MDRTYETTGYESPQNLPGGTALVKRYCDAGHAGIWFVTGSYYANFGGSTVSEGYNTMCPLCELRRWIQELEEQTRPWREARKAMLEDETEL